MPRAGIPANGNPPSMPPSPLPSAAGAAPRPVPARAAAARAGAAAVQACGTDNDPTKPACPIPADSAAALPPTKPAEADLSTPEPNPSAIAGANAAVADGSRPFSFSPVDRPALAIHAVELITDSIGLSELSAEDGDDSGEARPCNAEGSIEVTWVSAACVFVTIELPLTWATTAPCAASPAGLATCCGEVNGVNIDAAADEPA